MSLHVKKKSDSPYRKYFFYTACLAIYGFQFIFASHYFGHENTFMSVSNFNPIKNTFENK